jgi:hypothetical protein
MVLPMRGAPLACLLALAMLITTFPAHGLSASGSGDGGERAGEGDATEGREDRIPSDDREGKGRNGGRDAFEDRLAALARGPAAERLGRFNVTDDTARGTFVAFEIDRAACMLRNLTLQGVSVADRVAIDPPGDAARALLRADGSALRLDCAGGRIVVHDNPAAVVRADADRGADAVWALVAGLQVNVTMTEGENNGSSAVGLSLAAAGFRAALRLDGAHDLGQGVWSSTRGHLAAHGGNILLPEAANRHRGAIDEAKDRGRVGAEVTVVSDEGAPVADVLLLDDLDLEVRPGDGIVRVVLDGNVSGGRTIVVNAANGVLATGDLAVRYYDEVDGSFSEVPIIQAQGGIVDVLEPNDDSGPEYWVVHDRDGAQVLLSVPRFSAHAFQIQGLPFVEDLPPSVLAGAVAGAMAVAVAGAGLLRRRSR